MLNIITIALGVIIGQLVLMIAVSAFFTSKFGIKLYWKFANSMAAKLEEAMYSNEGES